MKTPPLFSAILTSLGFCLAGQEAAAAGEEARYTGMLDQLRTELTAKVPQNDQAKDRRRQLNKFLASDALDAKFAKYVVLLEATPQGLAEFAQQGKEQAALVEKMLADADLMKQMLVADGANAKREARLWPGTVRPGDEDLHRHPEGEQEGRGRCPAAAGARHQSGTRGADCSRRTPRPRPTPLTQSTR